MKKRFTLRFLIALVAVVAGTIWFCFVKTVQTISLPHQSSQGFAVGSNISIIHKTKGVKLPVFLVKNERLLQLKPGGSDCEFTFPASCLTKLNLWRQGYENLIVLPGTHD